ncbi:hypothetical protein [Deinococcus koreensis]|uniref:DUF3108 domain-containing protein n=1 Tax=Deinococcus koreensis TaxID=2054903 RepID=A0A2K3UX87_9DEIO|nr:hypothetical protein [Deinococcus koreensis]PNY81138.1 hypothetical protein CVO96_06880 [Deinococcus koreensis]
MTTALNTWRRTLLLTLMGTLGNAAHAACTSAYYPIREGLSRTYQGTVSGQKVSYTETVSRVSAGGFTVTTTVAGAPPTTATFKCGPAGVIATPAINNPALKITSIKQRGVTQPPELSVGKSWSSGVVLDGTAQGQAVHNETDIVMKVVSSEQIKTRLGTFTALKVVSTTTVRMTMAGQKMAPPAIESTSWLVKGMGLVRSALPGGTIELVKFK